MLPSHVNAVVTSFMKIAFWDLTARKEKNKKVLGGVEEG